MKRKKPSNKKEFFRRAYDLYRSGNFHKSLEICQDLYHQNPQNGEVLYLLGLLHAHFEDYAGAMSFLHKAREADPENPFICFHLGNICKITGRLEEAIDWYRKVLAMSPDFIQAMNNMGNTLRAKGEFHEAISYFKKALQKDPGYLNAYNNLGIVFLEMGNINQAIKSFEDALKIAPDYPLTHNNLGIALREKGNFDMALDSFREAIRINPSYTDARQNLSSLLLLVGKFRKGWEEYKWFWNVRGPYHKFRQPLWNGSDITGKTLLLHAGSGYGDTIQFIRYAPMIKEKGVSVMIGCQKELASLLSRAAGIDQVIVQGAKTPHFDVHCSMFRLPIIFDTTVETIPDNVPYISVDPHTALKWKNKLLDTHVGCRVGLTWSGGHNIGIYKQRSIPLELFSRLGELRNIKIYSLQIGSKLQAKQRVMQNMSLTDLSDHIHDFSDTAAFIENMDLIISIDTAVAHLAGALGKPVWTLLPLVPDWRWMLQRQDSPWYPTMRLYRQTAPGDWDSVISMVCDELKKEIYRKVPDNSS